MFSRWGNGHDVYFSRLARDQGDFFRKVPAHNNVNNVQFEVFHARGPERDQEVFHSRV